MKTKSNYRCLLLMFKIASCLGVQIASLLHAQEQPFEVVAPEPTIVEGSVFEESIITEAPFDETDSVELEMVPEVVSEVVSDPELSIAFGDWLGYNATQNDMTWIAGDEFGMFSMESFPMLSIGEESSLISGMGFHFLDGPHDTDMPARLFDFRLAYHVRKSVSDNALFDINIGIGAFSDFEGSSREGIRFPGHAVGYYEWTPDFVSVLGVEVLDRDDISLLPVGGIVWSPTDDLIWELVFPKPRLNLKMDSGKVFYMGGELGGGTWAIERTNATNDNVTYSDLRIVAGVKELGDSESSLEIGWVFDRSLEYRSGRGDYRPDDALILRLRSHY